MSMCCAILLNLRHLPNKYMCLHPQSGTNEKGIMTPLEKGKTAVEVLLLNQLQSIWITTFLLGISSVA